jgi:hypothetical protein
MRNLKAIIQHHQDRYSGKFVLDAVLSPRWNDVMVAILRLPVPVRDEPAAVSGEICAAR